MRILLGCCLIHLCIGSVYALSVLYPMIMIKTGWENEVLIIGFSLTILMLGLTAAVHQYIFQGISKFVVLCFAIIVWLGSNIVIFSNIILTHNFETVHYLFSLPLGFSIGLLYVIPINIVSKLNFSKKGLASGSVVGCFGLGSILSAKIFSNYINFSTSINIFSNSMSMLTFISICTFIMCLAISFMEDLAKQDDMIEFTEKFNRDSNWYLIALMFFLNIGIGISLLSNLALISLENDITIAQAAELVALAGLANTLGRFIYSAISDFIGKLITLGIIFSLQAVAVIMIKFGFYWELGILIVISVYGGMFAILPSFLKEIYNSSIAYSQMLSVWGFAGIVFPILFNYFSLSLLVILVFILMMIYVVYRMKTCKTCI